MIPLAMIVLDELRDHVPEVPLADGNEPIRHSSWNSTRSVLILVTLGLPARDASCSAFNRFRPEVPARLSPTPSAV